LLQGDHPILCIAAVARQLALRPTRAGMSPFSKIGQGLWTETPISRR
jgi:hypothetical protein